jgi:hypothetical protein
MPKGPSKNASTIQRLLEERRQYEAWLARLNSAANATPEPVRVKVGADYAARLRAVNEELKIHAEAALSLVEQRREQQAELLKKERAAAERLAEAELRHSVGEYDEAQWTQVHKDALSELVSVREELQSIQADIAQLEELHALVGARPGAAPSGTPRAGSPPRPPARPDARRPEPPLTSSGRRAQVDELAFLKSVTEDEKGPSPRRASGAQYQPSELTSGTRPGNSSPPAPVATPSSPASAPDSGTEPVKTLKCQECGTMNQPTEWYCEQCGAELAAL